MPEKRPSILILFAERHRGDCLSSAGHPVLLTPNMDHIGGEGTRFSSAYSTCPVCVPARRSLVSGQFPFTHGARTNVVTEWEIHNTLPQMLKENGYQTETYAARSMSPDLVGGTATLALHVPIVRAWACSPLGDPQRHDRGHSPR